MSRIMFSLVMLLITTFAMAQDHVSLRAGDWQHTEANASGSALEGTDTLFAKTDVFQVGSIQLNLVNKGSENPTQKVMVEVIYDDFATEKLELELSRGKQKDRFTRSLKHNKIRNVAAIRIYGNGQPVNVEISEAELTKTGRLENLNDADKSKVQYRPGPFEEYGVIRVTYPMAKPPFFMGVNSRKVSIQAYALPKKWGDEATGTLKVTCIDADKAWREEFVFDLTGEPDTYTFTLDKNLETEYEGYFMIFMPAPESNDIAIRMVEME